MTHVCPECDAEFDSDEALTTHVEEEHTLSAVADKILKVWEEPRIAFLIGFLVGIVVVGSIMVAPQSILVQTGPQEIGANVLHHYGDRAPPGVSYSLSGVTKHDPMLYTVTLNVTRGPITTQESVYVTANGNWLFETSPEHVLGDLRSLAESE